MAQLRRGRHALEKIIQRHSHAGTIMNPKKSALIALAIPALAMLSCQGNGSDTGSSSTGKPPTLSEKGRLLYSQNCATCHFKNKPAVGPPLAGALARWNNDTAHLKAFIRNPSKLISEGFPPAVQSAK